MIARFQALCESWWIRNINLQYWCQLFAIDRNGSYSNVTLKLNKFSPLKSLFGVNLNQINSLVFRLTGSTTTASLSFCNLWGKEQLAVKLPDDFSAQNHRASWYSRFFRQKLACGLLRESFYSNETLERRNKMLCQQKRTQLPFLIYISP